MLLVHLIDNDYFEAIEPPVQRGDIDAMTRPPRSMREEIQAKAKSAGAMLAAGAQIDLDEEEETQAVAQFHREIQQLPIQPAAVSKPAVILKLSALLSEYDHQVVRDAAQLREYVQNRLAEESAPDKPASTRLAALKMLGQITEVGLFTERTEITVKQLPVDTLEARLHDKLKVLLPQDVEVIDVPQQHTPTPAATATTTATATDAN